VSVLPALLFALALVWAPAAQAGADVSGGSTQLRLDSSTARVLTANGVTVTPVRPARAAGGSIAFPVTGGDVHPTYGSGTLEHSGGLTFRAAGKRLTLTDFTVRQTRSRGTLTAEAGGDRVPILTLNTRGSRVTRDGFGTRVRGVRATLSGPAAKALNATFGVKLFKRGLTIGTLDETIEPAEALWSGGSTALALDPGAAGALGSLGISAEPIGPATAENGGLAFPITSGNSNLETLAGTIRHSGGIALVRGATRVELTRFAIQVDDAPDLTALVGGQRVSILSLDVSGLTRAADGRTVTLGGVKASLTAAAAGALNQAFATDAFKEGLVLGTATVTAEGR
jgi:hypothetical protein